MESEIFGEAGADPLPWAVLGWALVVLLWAASLRTVYVCSVFEYGLFAMGDAEKRKLRESSLKEYRRIGSLLKDEIGSLSACAVGYVAGAVVCGLCAYEVAMLCGVGEWVRCGVGCVVASLGCLYVGEVLPRKLSGEAMMARLYYLSGTMWWIRCAVWPVAWLCKGTGYMARRLEAKRNRGISISELSETLEHAEIKNSDEKGILERIVSFGTVSAGEIMKPRVDVVMVDAEDDYEKVMKVVRESEYSRMPVYEGTVDNIKGVLYVKDLLKHIEEGGEFEWQKLVREPFFVPETKKIDDLLREFQKKRIHMAVIVDEFGGMAGIVTMEDVIEVIFGDISDEHDGEQRLYTELDKRNYLFEGKLALEDFYNIPKVDRRVFEEEEWEADTVAGMILEIRGDIPRTGDEIEYKGYLFKIVTADSRRIKKVKLRIPSEE